MHSVITFFVPTETGKHFSEGNFMANIKLDLHTLVTELREEEQSACNSGNEIHANGLSHARLLLEAVLKRHNIVIPNRLENLLG
jgi:hypothetical protein